MNSLPLLTGPRLAPRSGHARMLVVLVHGYGADGNDLIGLAPHWQGLMPDAAFSSPNGPERCGMNPMGYQWFAINRLSPEEIESGVRRAAQALDDFLDAELKHWGVAPDRLALVGFSQGTMMSLHVGLRRAVAPLGIVGYSGALAGAASLAPEIKVRPPVLLVHGEADEMIPAEALFAAAQALSQAGVVVRWHVSPGLGHGIDGDGIGLGGQFLAASARGELPTSDI